MIRIKICGITSVRDGLAAAQAGADAIGLVFYRRSPRWVSPEHAREIALQMPPFVSVVGLFVNATPTEVVQLAEQCFLDHIQLHGDESPEMCQQIPGRRIKAVRVATATDLMGLERYPVQAMLLDAKTTGLYGGTGHTFDWSLIRQGGLNRPFILAGGLHPDNVAQAIVMTQPYAVDVSSGVESAPGIKDQDRMVAFVKAVHASENKY